MRISGRGKRQVVASIYCALRFHKVLLKLEGFLRDPVIRIATYHRVVDHDQLLDYSFDADLIEVTTKEFKAQLAFLSSNFDVISFTDLIECQKGNARLPKRPLLITFDDGFRDNYDHAFPVIQEVNVPVTIMLATGYIGGKKTFWYDWLAFIVFNIDTDIISLDSGKIVFKLPPLRVERRAVFYQIIRYLKYLSDVNRQQVLDELDMAYGALYDNLQENICALSQPMNWGQVREMSAAGIEFGSHTVTHPYLSRVSNEQLYIELRDSKQKIEDEVGQEVSVIAYPNGQEEDFNDEVKKVAHELGYRFGLSYIHGVNRGCDIDCFEMRRLRVHPANDCSLYKMIFSLPAAI